MTTLLRVAGAALLGIHGLIHLMGFFAYWPLLVLAELPYKTTILGGSLDLGTIGMRAYSLLWLAAALGFISTGVAFAAGWKRWQSVLLATTLLSVMITTLDWSTAFRGTLLDVAILLAVIYVTHNTRSVTLRGR